MPQLAIQIVALIWTIGGVKTRSDSETGSDLLITILSMLFTVVSILLSAFEHAFSSKFVKNQSIMIIRFFVRSQKIADFGGKAFANKLIFTNKHKLIHLFSKILQLNRVQIERLIPIQSSRGATFVLIVDAPESRLDSIWDCFDEAVYTGTFSKQLSEIYKLGNECDIPQNTLFHAKLNHRKESNVIDFVVDSAVSLNKRLSGASKNTNIGLKDRTSNNIDDYITRVRVDSVSPRSSIGIGTQSGSNITVTSPIEESIKLNQE